MAFINVLERVKNDLSIKIQTCAILSDRELHRDFDVEAYISKYAKDGKKLKAWYCSQMSL